MATMRGQLLFPGQYYDQDSGLHHNFFRVYKYGNYPTLGVCGKGTSYRPRAPASMYSLAALTAVAASPAPAAMRRIFPGYVAMSPAA